jgi:hypothetical protein
MLALLTCVLRAYGDAGPEQYASECQAGVDDTGCWQRALRDARTNGSFVASAGHRYRIRNTLTVCNGIDGVVDGRGAILEWAGPPNVPMFLIVNSYHMVFTHLTIRARAPHPLQAAFELTSAKSDPPGLDCAGTPRPASKNTIEHVEVEGGALNDIMFGVRMSNRFGYDANNDMTRIVNVNFSSITTAAVSVETTQAHQNVLIDDTGYGAPGNRGCFVQAETGFISSIGGFQGLWGRAAFCVNGGYGPFSIVNPNSEGSARLVLVGNAGDVAGYPVTVNISGGRFAADAMEKDGRVISFNRLGSLSVRGLRIDGGRPNGVEPSIAIQPGRPAGSAGAVSVDVDGVVFFMKGSDRWNVVVAPAWASVSERGNICVSEDGIATNCRRWVDSPAGRDANRGADSGSQQSPHETVNK